LIGKDAGVPAIRPANFAPEAHLSGDFVLPIRGKWERDSEFLVAATQVRKIDIGGEVRSKNVP
jgi:hypothetical protein